ncbi:phosphoribosylanthranilate isomerase [Desulfonatronum thioautotrophicum]|uniref:phosphoribosylanthranilate isomerase n=1 Tax=Desulfonatronum thioautotrophicum TaxID=617001 RepID=UPI0005EBA364|nr:phosphoribosylanthranilate isomerase [Desulfonatronum thioautotrophicum]
MAEPLLRNDGRGRSPLVKVCGLRRPEDVLLCEELGVQWTGFIFYPPSPRNVIPDHVASLPRSRALRVGVFVLQPAEEVREIMNRAELDLAQLHGGQDQRFCEQIGPDRVIKVFWPRRHPDLTALEKEMAAFTSSCRALLVDAGTSVGGHGVSLDFPALARLNFPRPWLLAGGLGPENIQEALHACRPWGVDLNSGVEETPGQKSPEMLRQVMQRIMATPNPVPESKSKSKS